MPFPISIKYKRTFTKKIDPETYSAILHNIENFILPKPAKDIVIEGNKLNFKPGAGFSNWNIMGAIDKGSFELTEKNGRVTLTYEIFMYRLFIVVPIMSVFFALVPETTIWAGVGCLLWLGGMNWIIGYVRHQSLFNELVQELDLE